MLIGVPKETSPGERRVALVPSQVAQLTKEGLDVCVEAGAGMGAGIPDAQFADKGARILDDHDKVLGESDVLLMVNAYGANPNGKQDLAAMGNGTIDIVVGSH